MTIEKCSQMSHWIQPSTPPSKSYLTNFGSVSTACPETGWSYGALKDIADGRRDPGFNAQTISPTVLHHALTKLCNRMLRGEIYGIACDLLVAARLNMVPKNGDSY